MFTLAGATCSLLIIGTHILLNGVVTRTFCRRHLTQEQLEYIDNHSTAGSIIVLIGGIICIIIGA